MSAGCSTGVAALACASKQTHSIGYAVGESHELDLIAGALPVGVEGQHQSQGRGMRIRMVVGQGDLSEGREHTAVDAVCGAHTGYDGNYWISEQVSPVLDSVAKRIDRVDRNLETETQNKRRTNLEKHYG